MSNLLNISATLTKTKTGNSFASTKNRQKRIKEGPKLFFIENPYLDKKNSFGTHSIQINMWNERFPKH